MTLTSEQRELLERWKDCAAGAGFDGHVAALRAALADSARLAEVEAEHATLRAHVTRLREALSEIEATLGNLSIPFGERIDLAYEHVLSETALSPEAP